MLASRRRMTSASPWPPPPQIATPPRSTPRRRSSCASVRTSRAPLAPIGCPSATAPPLTFTMLLVEPEDPRHVQRDGRERLVDLEQAEVVDVEVGLLQRVLERDRRHRVQVREALGGHPVRHDLGERLQAELLGLLRAGHDDRGGAVADLRRVARRDRPALRERGLQRGERLGRRVGADPLVAFDHDTASPVRCGTSTGTTSSASAPDSQRGVRALVRARRPGVLLLRGRCRARRSPRRRTPPCAAA